MKLQLVFIICLLFMIYVSKSYATESDWYYPTSGTYSCSGTLSGAFSDILLPDNNDWICSGVNKSIDITGFNFTGIPTGNNISIDAVKFHIKSSANSSGWTWSPKINNASSSLRDGYYTPYQFNTIVGSSTNDIYFTNNTTLNGNNYASLSAQLTSSSHDYQMSFDDFKIKLLYYYNSATPSASLNMSNIVASASAGTTTFDIDGYACTIKPNTQCNINLHMKHDSYVDPTSIATIVINNTPPNTETMYMGDRQYEGYGFTTSDNHWHANSITIPYFDNVNTQIAQSVNCFQTQQNEDNTISYINDCSFQGIDSRSDNYDSNAVASPSALQNAPKLDTVVCDKSDTFYFICELKAWFVNTMRYLFVPDTLNSQWVMDDFKNRMNTKVPFAYIADLSQFNFTTTSTTSALTFTIPMDIPAAPMKHDIPPITFSTTDDTTGVFTTIVTWFKNICIAIIALVFVRYLISVARRII